MEFSLNFVWFPENRAYMQSTSTQKNACSFFCFVFFLAISFVYIFPMFRPWIYHFGVNEVARMSFINAGGPNEAL